MATQTGKRNEVMEIDWMPCGRCGAPGPHTEHSRISSALHPMCCDSLLFRTDLWKRFHDRGNDTEGSL